MLGHPAEFDAATIAYLKDLDKHSGFGHDGVFIRRPVGWFNGPRSGWGLLLLLGGVCLAAAVLVCFLPEKLLTLRNQPWIRYVQGAATGLGLLCLLSGVARYRRPRPAVELRSFLFADGAYLWDVTPEGIGARPLGGLIAADGFHSFENGAYRRSKLTLRFGDGEGSHAVHDLSWAATAPSAPSFHWGGGSYELYDKASAERLVGFLQAQLMFRSAPEADIRHMAAVAPGLLAALAIRVVDSQRGGTAPVPENCPNPPTPALVSPAVPPEPAAARGLAWRFLAAAALGGLSILAFAALNRLLLDDHWFGRVPVAYTGDLTPFDRYLAAFPDGRHAAEVRERRDDHMFQRAVASAERADSPADLRDYLADANNQRHRKEARERIAGYYDRAIADLKRRAGERPGQVDEKLFNAFLAVLAAMKQADHPVVTVGFKPRLDPEPATPQQKDLERAVYDILMQRHPDLKGVAERQPEKTAILSRGQVFDAEQVARREEVILSRLTHALKQAIKQEVLTLRAVPAGQTPVLEVGYHVYASGQLGPYQRTTAAPGWGGNPGGPGARREIVGLVRWYHIKWTITVRPAGTAKPFVYHIESEPLLRLNYDSQPGDPDWAPYAVILYSGFHDMSARLIRNFGLDPGPALNAFTFAAAASTKAEAPLDPIDPLRPGMPAMGSALARSEPWDARLESGAAKALQGGNPLSQLREALPTP